ncbi:MAG: lactonase family protein [Candidatus Thiodiazotropha sp. (ex Monitilora ramsayi)]|nr:lactonase family protein [Candidatus Thiodiazotropha sp. (ex Monitilora ramsayi)]
MKRPVTKLRHAMTLLPLLALSLTGCGGGSGGGGGTPPPTSPPVARFAYVANSADDTISVFIANNTTGQLRHHGYALTGDGPNSLTIDPSGEFAYTTNTNSTDISLFTINSLSGELTPSLCDRVNTNLTCGTGGGTPVSLAFNPNGLLAYVANQVSDTLTVHSMDLSDGSLSSAVAVQNPIDTNPSTGPRKILLHPDGDVLYVVHDGSDDIGIYDISATDGTLLEKAVGSPVSSGGTLAMDMVITPDGQNAYVVNRTSGHLGVFTVDGSGLLAANGSPVDTGLSPHALAVDSTGQWLYMISREASGTVSVFEIQTDGTLLQINCNGTTQRCPVGDTPESITVDTTGQFISVTNGVDNTASLFTINQTTGELTDSRTLSARSAPGALAYLADPAEATITPRFAYVANRNGNSISSFTIDSSDGTLTGIGPSPVTAGLTPSSVTADPSGRFVYATNSASNDVSGYTIDTNNGSLTQMGASPFSLIPSFGPQSISVEPSGRFAYTANASDSISAFSINQNNGALTLESGLSTASTDPIAISVDPTGRFAYVANTSPTDSVSAFSIAADTGALTSIGTIAAGSAPNDVAIDPSGRFVYVANVGIASYNISAYSIDSTTGALTEIPGSPFPAGSAPFSITVDPLGQFVYVANQSSQSVTRYIIDPISGELTAGSTTVSTGLNNPQSITAEPSGGYVYVANGGANSISGYTIDATTGDLSSIGTAATTGSFPQSIVTTATVQ